MLDDYSPLFKLPVVIEPSAQTDYLILWKQQAEVHRVMMDRIRSLWNSVGQPEIMNFPAGKRRAVDRGNCIHRDLAKHYALAVDEAHGADDVKPPIRLVHLLALRGFHAE